MPENGMARNESGARSWIPLANISETENEYLIKVELPDVKKEDLKIAVTDGVITISGEHKLEREDKGENEIRVEQTVRTAADGQLAGGGFHGSIDRLRVLTIYRAALVMHWRGIVPAF